MSRENEEVQCGSCPEGAHAPAHAFPSLLSYVHMWLGEVLAQEVIPVSAGSGISWSENSGLTTFY